jgi:TonB family protein
MAYHSTSGREFLQSASWTEESGAQPDNAAWASPPDTDIAELAAKFAAPSGPGLSPELAVDLALQMVLHEIVEQASLATGATGAAIALYHEGELVCRASHGLTAPTLGARLDAGTGLSGECLRTQQIQVCDDARTDLGVDFEVCSQLGVYSIVVLPLLRAGKIAGIFEVLSSRPSAFGEREIGALEELAKVILKNLERAATPSMLKITESSSSGSDLVADQRAEEDREARNVWPWVNTVTRALAVVVLAFAVWLGLRVAERLSGQKAAVRRPLATAKSSTEKSSAAGVNHPSSTATGSATAARFPPVPLSPVVHDRPGTASPAGRSRTRAPEGGLRVYENGREVFRIPPLPEAAPEKRDLPAETGLVQASSVQPEKVLALSPSAAESGVIYRVEPEYPEEARLAGIQGSVVLDVHIRPDGYVEQVEVVSGEAVLASAATAAVKQWRFKPRQVSGQPGQMQTTVTLNFRLPS